MRSRTTRSSLLLIIGICLVILLSSGGISTIYITQTIKSDAEIINKLGIIRGSIQRLVKLEAAGMETDDSIEAIDTKIEDFKQYRIKLYDSSNEINEAVGILSQTWAQLKLKIQEYRESPTLQNQKELLDLSEKIWQESNYMVLTSQMVSERKVTNYKISYVFSAINLLLGFIIILLIKKYVKDRLEYLVNKDDMTNVYNRRHFDEYLNTEIARSDRYATGFSFIIYDIDYFKRVNDQYGHDVGDCVLKELTELVSAGTRKSDLIFRIGGEEFAIVTPDTLDSAYELAEKVRKLVEEHSFRFIEKLTISLGVTQYVTGDTPDTLYKRADVALYKAKSSGRNKTIRE